LARWRYCRCSSPAGLLGGGSLNKTTSPNYRTSLDAGRAIPIRLLKGLIWVYLSIGILIILSIAIILFVLPLFSSGGGASTDLLDLMEKILLCWGLILLPFLKVAQVFVKRHQREKSVA
jgi:hypothetical protein